MNDYRRLLLSAYALAKRRSEAKARIEIESLADRFERVNAQTLAEIKALRSEIARSRAIETALVAEREARQWLN